MAAALDDNRARARDRWLTMTNQAHNAHDHDPAKPAAPRGMSQRDLVILSLLRRPDAGIKPRRP
jgi:hypothetical protein